MGLRGDDITADEPYVPDDEVAEVLAAKPRKSTRERMEEGPVWQQPKVHKGNSKLPFDAKFVERIQEIEAKLDSGAELSTADANYIQYRVVCRLATSSRPAMAARAVTLLQNATIKKLIEASATRVEKVAEHGLVLPGESSDTST